MEFEIGPPKGDYAEIFSQWRQEPNTIRFNPIEARSIEELRQALAETAPTLTDLKEQTAYRWFARLDGELIGTVSLQSVSLKMGTAEIGYMLTQDYQGRGLGQRLVQQWIEQIFRETPLRKLIAYVAEENIASIRILEKAGFQREGFLREHYIFNGKIVNEYLFGLLRREARLSTDTRPLYPPTAQ
jgi:ribosomal-protein-alanine N-acetyltransferase